MYQAVILSSTVLRECRFVVDANLLFGSASHRSRHQLLIDRAYIPRHKAHGFYARSINPDPETRTRITGRILNNNKQALAGLTVRSGSTTATTDANGQFTLVFSSGQQPGEDLVVQGRTINSITYQTATKTLRSLLGRLPFLQLGNAIEQPIYLNEVDPAHTRTIQNPATDTVTITNPLGPDLGGITIPAGTINSTGQTTITLSKTEIENTLITVRDAAGGLVTFEVAIALALAVGTDVPFTKNLPVTMPVADLPFNEWNLLRLDSRTGEATVVGSGTRGSGDNPNQVFFQGGGLGSGSGGFGYGGSGGGVGGPGIYLAVPSPIPPTPIKDIDRNPEEVCVGCKSRTQFTSDVELHSGILEETHRLVTYQAQGETRGLRLRYNSMRADPRPIVHFNHRGVPASTRLHLIAQLFVRNGNYTYQVPGYTGTKYGLRGGEHIWSVPEGGGEVGAALQVDMRSFATGQYDYTLVSGIKTLYDFNGTRRYFGMSSPQIDKLVVVNRINSAFGSGWDLEGLQELVETDQGRSVLLVDGNGTQLIFNKTGTNNGITQFRSASGDFSVLTRLSNNQYERILADGTRYLFSSTGKLETVQTSNNRTTQYSYQEGRLIKIDEISNGLTQSTQFSYYATGTAAGRVQSITDPAGRVTRLEYHDNGTLKRIIDPDQTFRTWEYDAHRRMTVEVDQRGYREEAVYDFAGRAQEAKRKDGTTLRVKPAQVQGLRPASETTDPDNVRPALAFKPGEGTSAIAEIRDGNGNIIRTGLDKAKQEIFSKPDDLSPVQQIERKDPSGRDSHRYLPSATTTASGYRMEYQYDALGNQIEVRDTLANHASINALFNSAIDGLTAIETKAVSGARTFTTADFNRDGVLDWAAANNVAISVGLGNGNGSFATLTYTAATAIRSLSVVDFNRDGNLDLVALTSANRLSAWFGNTQGLFGSEQPYTVTLPTAITEFAVRDLNGDQFADLVFLSGNTLSVQMGTGFGTFGTATSYMLNGTGITFKFGNLNRDQMTDIVVLSRGSNRSDATTLTSTGNSYTMTSYQVAANSQALTIHDFDLNGLIDRIATTSATVGNVSGSLSLLSANANGGFDLATLAVGGSFTQVEFGDVTGDGLQDLVLSEANRFSVLRWNSGFSLNNRLDFATSTTPEGLQLGDFDRDGLLDVAMLNTNGTVSVRLNTRNLIVPEQPATGRRTYRYDQVFDPQSGQFSADNTGIIPGTNQLVEEVDELGRRTIYQYVNGRVSRKIQVVNSTSTNPADDTRGGIDTAEQLNNRTGDDLVISYTYTSDGRIHQETDALGRTTTYEYTIDDKNPTGQLRRVRLPRIYDISSITVMEYVREYEYDSAGNLVAEIDENGNRTEYTYKAGTNLIQRIRQADPDGAGPLQSPITVYEYDNQGRQIRITDANGNVTENKYDAMGRLSQTIGADPDKDGPLQRSITRYQYDDNGNQTKIIDAIGRVTEYRYDKQNRLEQILSPDQAPVVMQYDFNGNVVQQNTGVQTGERSFFDGRGRRILSIDAQNNATRFVYDAANQLIAEIAANGKITRFRYDAIGRQIERIETFNGTTASTKTEYDKHGNVIASIDALGNRTEYRYDELNRRVMVIDAKATATDPGFSIMVSTAMTYDRVGNLLSLKAPQNTVTQYRYDALSRLTAETVTLSSGSEVSRSFEYDAMGNRTKVVDRNGRSRTFTFDGLNRQTEEVWVGASRSITSSYDAVNQLRRITDGSSTYEFDYDGQGRIRWIDNSGTLNSPRVRFTYTYDFSTGNLTSVEDMINGQVGAKTTYGYDAFDRISSVNQSGGTTQPKRVGFSYNRIGQLEAIHRSVNGQRVANSTYIYDALDRLVSLQHTNGAGANISGYTYGYSGLTSRIDRITDRTGTTSFTYDQIHQLTGADRDGTTNDEAYSYDFNGNRSNYQTDSDNRLRSDGTFTYTYDNEGNLIRQVGGGTTREFEWDHRNQLIRVRDLNSSGVETRRVDYTYDVFGQRLGKVVDSDGAGSQGAVTTRFVYDRNHVALEFSGNTATPIQRYLYGVQTDQILAQELNGVTTWHLADHLGSVRELIDNTGKIVNQYTYDSFGKLLSAQAGATINTRYRYTGREWDGETGLYYYRARSYDTNTGRFISQDPIGFQAGDTNLYRYVGNKVVN